MQEIAGKAIEKVIKRFGKVLKDFPEKRKQAIQQVGTRMQGVVRESIDKNINDSGGKVKGWQSKYSGKGFYAAIKAKRGETGKNSPGAITNYLENGHYTKGRKSYVAGYHFYRDSRKELDKIAAEECQKAIDEVKGALNRE